MTFPCACLSRFVLISGLALLLSCSGGPERRRQFDLSSIAAEKADHHKMLIAVYGAPERDDSTEADVPRPPIVTRIVEYRPQSVKLVFVPEVEPGTPPPYDVWRLWGAIDMTTNTKMSIPEAADRLRSRLLSR